ncbi:MAG: asparagine synthase (glutamine-hydrolyzing) [Chitinophagaceae bacterium]|nr:asparagine synthase (glutamine-hydrolyzing) [Chitinophagaceae bacterium]
MCRIAAIIGEEDHLESQIQSMTHAMHRGGPDDGGHIVNDALQYALGHRRLAIIDLSPLGHQPMMSVDSSIEIVYNGEIYNFLEIKEELKLLGHSFKSNSDTEVIIQGYQAWGIHIVEKLRGMFAFVLIDKNTNTLFAARDHAGIKPLYIGRKNEAVYFSSEVRGLKAIDEDWEENEHWKIWFLAYGFLPEPITTLKNVEPLPRGHYMTIDLKTKEEKIVCYYQYQYQNKQVNYADAVATTKALVSQSVKRHLIADVPVGVFLSGGIDSSLLSILAQQQQSSPIETLSIYFDDEKYSEKEYQDIIVKQTGVKHHFYKVSKQEFLDSWNEIYESLDQPSTDAINTHFICKYAHQLGLKVVLSGLGADELFGGYPSVKHAHHLNKYHALAMINKLVPASLFSTYPKRKIQYLNTSIASKEYLFYRGLFTPKDIATILEMDEDKVVEELSTYTFQENISSITKKNRAAYYDTAIYMQSQLLKDSDTQSMWHSLELRVPFLDRDLMAYVNNLEESVKFQHQSSKPKALLVDAFINELPEAIWNRPKKGFTFPFENWFGGMKVFENNKLMPTWVNQKFKNKDYNFSRLWSVFLTAPKKELDQVAVLN